MVKKKPHHEEHVDETWLIPYADMLTLLLALFIVMFAMSQIDKEKFQKISEQFNVIFAGGSGSFERDGNRIIPLKPDLSSKSTNNEKDGKVDSILEDDKMKEIKILLEKEIEAEGFSEKIHLVLNNEGLDISIQDSVLFESGDAAIMNGASPVLTLLAKILTDINNSIKIVGHTDNVPVKGVKFRSNWDLSAIRAINVMQFIADEGGIDQSRFLIQGNGEYSPKYNNTTEVGRAKNRRVEIIIIRKYPLVIQEGK